MIDLLSNPNWINQQIDFLLFLQNIRITHFEAYNKIFLSITILGEIWLPTLICAITYWCIDFRAGLYLFSLASINVMITHFAKMLACVYRPCHVFAKICRMYSPLILAAVLPLELHQEVILRIHDLIIEVVEPKYH